MEARPEEATTAVRPALPEAIRAPLPPVDQPLAPTIAELRARAAAGEAAASCRLAAEYFRCGSIPFQRASLARWLLARERALDRNAAVGAQSAELDSIDQQVAQVRPRLAELEQHCMQVTLPPIADTVRHWRRAALAGNAAALRQYASGNALPGSQALHLLPELAEYRREAEALALRAASDGDLDMMGALAVAYEADQQAPPTLLAQAVKPDPAHALALYRHIESLLSGPIPEAYQRFGEFVGGRARDLQQRLDAAELAHAQERQQELSGWKRPELRGVPRFNGAERMFDPSTKACEW